MYTTVQKYNDPQTAALRQEVGRWLKERREAVGRSQREVADIVGVEFYTWVSQLETGRGRVPPDRYEAYARALNLDVRELVMKLFPHYDPVTAKVLFPSGDEGSNSERSVGNSAEALKIDADAALWHREASCAQKAFRELERKTSTQLHYERDRAEAAEAKLRDVEALFLEAAYIAAQPAENAPDPKSFFSGFMGMPVEVRNEAYDRLAQLGFNVRKALKEEMPSDSMQPSVAIV